MAKNTSNSVAPKAPKSVGASVGASAAKAPTEYEAIIDRLKAVYGVTSDSALARHMGLTQGSISGAKSKRVVPPAWIVHAAMSQGVSADWLLTGRGQMRPRPDIIYNDTTRTISVPEGELQLVPLVEARLSAGSGSFESSSEVAGYYAFRSSWLLRRGQPQAMVLMRVSGDSMEPLIHHGDTVLIDTSQTTPLPGRLYAVSLEGLVYIKRVEALPGRLTLCSANPAYPPLEITPETPGVRLVGRVLWCAREMD